MLLARRMGLFLKTDYYKIKLSASRETQADCRPKAKDRTELF